MPASQLEEARSRYTAKHLDVVHLQQEIAEIEQRKRVAEKPTPAVAANEEVANAPTLQLRGQLKATELGIANGRKQIHDLELQIAAYQARLNLAPERDQQLAGLTRNYTQSRTNYEALLAKRMQSQMATNVEARQKGEQFRTLDPPSIPGSQLSQATPFRAGRASCGHHDWCSAGGWDGVFGLPTEGKSKAELLRHFSNCR